MANKILFDAGCGMWMLPRGDRTAGCSSWFDSAPRLYEFTELTRLNRGGPVTDGWVDVIVALVPRPDNDYNPAAISVAQPVTYGGSHRERHMGYLRDKDHPARFPVLAQAAGPVEVGCHARYRIGQHNVELVLMLPGDDELHALVDDFLRRRPDPAVAARAAEIQAAPVPPARERQAALWAELDSPVMVSGDAQPGTVRVQQRSVFGNRMVSVVTPSGGRVGQLRDGILWLEDERQRRAAMHALGQAGITVAGNAGASPYPDAVLIEEGGRWVVRPRDGRWPIAVFDPADRILRVHAGTHREAAVLLLSRHGVTPEVVRWGPPDPEVFLARTGFVTPAERDAQRAHSLAEQNVYRMWARHRALLPDGLYRLSPLHWTSDDVHPIFAGHGVEWMHEDAYYLRDLETVFGEHVRRPGVAACRLCGKNAVEIERPGSPPLAYCSACVGRVVKGCLYDHGNDEPWEPLAVWSLRELAAELGGLPSQAQIARITAAGAEQTDRAMVVRMHVPRTPRGRGAAPKQRGQRVWAEWLSRAGLLDDGMPTARGMVSAAADGHLCRSLLERHIDDFMTANGIVHEVEPSWPYDAELNTTGMRADWLLGDGTYVEAWGLASEPGYAGKMARKAELAARAGIRLVGVTSADLHRLHEVFADWLGVDFPRPVVARAPKPRTPATAPPGNANNAGLRSERLERCREAVALQEAGLSRAGIAAKLGVGADSLKALLRDGKFYADPSSDPSRLELATAAFEARTAGLTKNGFRENRRLTTPKANESWRDADVLFAGAGG